MPDFILPEPPPELKQVSNALTARIGREIGAQGLIPFSRYMEMALYEPGLGYYSAGLHKLGKDGDFVTAPELGSLFAACLAGQIEEVAEQLCAYDILELGAGSGQMAVDVLEALPAAHQPRRYCILERSADLRDRQERLIFERLPEWRDRVVWLTEPPRAAWKGVLLANEVVDALAVERFRVGVDGIEQCCVGRDDDAFVFRYRAAPAALGKAVTSLKLEGGRPYVSEINLHLPEWLQAVTASLEAGLALFIDYGYPRAEYYRPDRSDGTLMCHYRHHAHGEAFFWPGLQDLTAFVDFTALAEAGETCGLELAGYTSQTLFLLGCGMDLILSRRTKEHGEDAVKLNAEARQLTLPGGMGERFQVMALTRGLDQVDRNRDLCGFSLRDLRHRL